MIGIGIELEMPYISPKDLWEQIRNKRTEFRSVRIQADFDDKDLSGFSFMGCDLSGSTFQGANLSCANLAKSNLKGCDFTECRMVGANLYKADLTGASLFRVNLYGANLQDTKGLTYLSLASSNLKSAVNVIGVDGVDIVFHNRHGRDWEEARQCGDWDSISKADHLWESIVNPLRTPPVEFPSFTPEIGDIVQFWPDLKSPCQPVTGEVWWKGAEHVCIKGKKGNLRTSQCILVSRGGIVP